MNTIYVFNCSLIVCEQQHIRRDTGCHRMASSRTLCTSFETSGTIRFPLGVITNVSFSYNQVTNVASGVIPRIFYYNTRSQGDMKNDGADDQIAAVSFRQWSTESSQGCVTAERKAHSN